MYHSKKISALGILLSAGIVFAACSPKADTASLPAVQSETQKGSTVSVCEKPFEVAADPLNVELDKTETFGAQDDAFTLKYPTGAKWNVVDNGDYINMFSLDKGIDDRVSVLFHLTSVPGITLDQYADSMMPSISAHPNADVLENCTTEINGHQVRKIVWTGDEGQFPNLKTTEYILVKNDKVMRIQYQTTLPLYEKFEGVAGKIIASLELKY